VDKAALNRRDLRSFGAVFARICHVIHWDRTAGTQCAAFVDKQQQVKSESGLDPVVESDAATTLSLMASGAIQASHIAAPLCEEFLMHSWDARTNSQLGFARVAANLTIRPQLADCRHCRRRICLQRSVAEHNLTCWGPCITGQVKGPASETGFRHTMRRP
jgi:hypothetical protein